MGNQKCYNRDAATGVMIPMCRPCFAGDTIKETLQTIMIMCNHKKYIKIRNCFCKYTIEESGCDSTRKYLIDLNASLELC